MKLTGDRNQCPTCGEFFDTTEDFDLHRYGAWRERKCKDPNSMRYMEKDQWGFWKDVREPGVETSAIS